MSYGGICMNIIIVGCGKVGETLAEQLGAEDNAVTVIDSDAGLVSDVSSRLDIMGVVGNGATLAAQEEAGIGHADLLIAVTGSDELNLLCCLVAKKAGSCQTIARVRNPAYSREAAYLKEEFGLAMLINPEQAAAAEIARILRFPSAIKIDTFARGRVELLKFRLPEGCKLVGMTVKDVAMKLKCDVLFCTAERDDQVYITKGDFVFCEKDIISIIASPTNASEFFKKIDYKMRSAKDVMIVGGNELTHYLCNMLRRDGTAVTVIDQDAKKCEELSLTFPDVKILLGDPSDQSFLRGAGIEHTDAFVTLTHLDEENILLSLFAKSESHGKVITKLQRTDLDNVVKHLDLDSTIYPKQLTADRILRYVRATQNSRGSNMETLYNLIKGEVEAAEFVIKDTSNITGIPLSQLKIKNDVLLGAIIHNGQVRIPRGHDTIQPGDTVIVVSKLLALHDITDILQ